jgi:hypothetical protein
VNGDAIRVIRRLQTLPGLPPLVDS